MIDLVFDKEIFDTVFHMALMGVGFFSFVAITFGLSFGGISATRTMAYNFKTKTVQGLIAGIGILLTIFVTLTFTTYGLRFFLTEGHEMSELIMSIVWLLVIAGGSFVLGNSFGSRRASNQLVETLDKRTAEYEERLATAADEARIQKITLEKVIKDVSIFLSTIKHRENILAKNADEITSLISTLKSECLHRRIGETTMTNNFERWVEVIRNAPKRDDLDFRAPPPKINVRLDSTDPHGIWKASQFLDIFRVEEEDDGSFTVVLLDTDLLNSQEKKA